MRTRANGIIAALAAAALTVGCTATDGEGPDTTAGGGDPAGPTVEATSTPVPPDAGATQDGITVVGSGVASGEPDVVRVLVGVQVQRDDVQRALDDANQATEEVLAVLEEQGIAEEDLQTRDFSVQPSQEPGEDGQVEISGYEVRNLVEATVRDVDAVGVVVQAAAEAAGDDALVQGVRFDLEDDGEQMTAAREAALADARAKAEQYASLIDAELGAPLSIQDRTTGSPRSAAAAAEMAADAAAVPIEPGQQDVTVQVTVRWAVG